MDLVQVGDLEIELIAVVELLEEQRDQAGAYVEHGHHQVSLNNFVIHFQNFEGGAAVGANLASVVQKDVVLVI